MKESGQLAASDAKEGKRCYGLKKEEEDVGPPYRNRGRLPIAAGFVGFLKTKWVKVPMQRRRRRGEKASSRFAGAKERGIDGDAISWHG